MQAEPPSSKPKMLTEFLAAGNSIFFTVKRIEDPIGLLPARLILGINKRGVHFFRPVPKEYLHSAELRDIMQFGSSSQAVFFKMRVAGVLHIFQFDTRQGEDICMALQTHINDIMMKRYSKVLRHKTYCNAVLQESMSTFPDGGEWIWCLSTALGLICCSSLTSRTGAVCCNTVLLGVLRIAKCPTILRTQIRCLVLALFVFCRHGQSSWLSRLNIRFRVLLNQGSAILLTHFSEVVTGIEAVLVAPAVQDLHLFVATDFSFQA